MPPRISSAVLVCSRCEEETASSERGWRAYVRERRGHVDVVVVCPECSERWYGEDETRQ